MSGNNMWNAWAFIEEMYKAFPDVVAFVRENKETYEERALEAARLGFGNFWSLDDWGIKEITYFEDFLHSEDGHSEANLRRLHGEYAEAFGVFSLFVYGALVAKRGIGEIDQRDFFIAEAQLTAFIFAQMNDVLQSYIKK